ncbi:DUF4836 family protein [Bacteroides pyogenes]|uniref:DUF4836 family protein n=1 Tax=Bacteroides pyogenes TaxID=310300 RepID=UPI001BACA771|nr:DUF4836 family protein [Bacteroides pyogenes]MBR8707958.1 hypothetical protein [Bacteroides pyogenes]MBR8716565.1 hypothetical protein [Bacteroides pyogenes]MBR8746329.1 hypothetical protein [Bacteroides pyogenes]MBR8756581.1 hypothetical protein [Bacteroides pyogenes]MBR8779827.1 hypothetical protein [Bacteroides pyogenes]
MKKKLIAKISALAILIAFFTACSKKVEYTNAIPADASFVVSIDLKSLIDKTGIDNKENESVRQKIVESLKSGLNASAFQHVEKIIKNPQESGINIKSPVYIFKSPTFNEPVLLAEISNEDKLHKSLEYMEKENICQPVSETDGYCFTTFKKELIVFNNSAVMMTLGRSSSQTESVQKRLAALLKQSAEQSIHQSEAFRKTSERKEDIKLMASMETLSAKNEKLFSLGSPTGIDLRQITVISGLNFEKGKISLKTENYTENDTIQAFIKKHNNTFIKPKGVFNKYFPASTLMFITFGIKGDQLYELLNIKNLSLGETEEIKAIVDSFNGDITAGLINVTMENVPAFMAYAEVSDNNAVQRLYANKQKMNLRKGSDILQLGKNEYVYKSKNMNIFFGVKDKQMYATNDEMLYKRIGKAAEKSVKDAVYASEMKGNPLYMAINAEAIADLPLVKMIISFNSKEAQTLSGLLAGTSHLSVSFERETSDITLHLKNKNDNALKQIVEFAKQFAGM